MSRERPSKRKIKLESLNMDAIMISSYYKLFPNNKPVANVKADYDLKKVDKSRWRMSTK